MMDSFFVLPAFFFSNHCPYLFSMWFLVLSMSRVTKIWQRIYNNGSLPRHVLSSSYITKHLLPTTTSREPLLPPPLHHSLNFRSLNTR